MTSVILTIHNKAWLIDRVLHGIFENSRDDDYELIIVIDGCTDNSESVVESFCELHKPSRVPMKILHAPNVFETKANNLAARSASGETIVIVQDDMVIKENGWLSRMRKPIREFSDIFAVTARTAHNWVYNTSNAHERLDVELDNCWCDILLHVDHANRKNTPRDVFAIRESVNRGPLMIRHDVLQKMDYFDEKFSPQDMDDHDLCYRTYKSLGMRSGCYWIDFDTQDEWGGTRVGGSTAPWLLKANHKNMKIVWNRHRDLILSDKKNESRILI